MNSEYEYMDEDELRVLLKERGCIGATIAPLTCKCTEFPTLAICDDPRYDALTSIYGSTYIDKCLRCGHQSECHVATVTFLYNEGESGPV